MERRFFFNSVPRERLNKIVRDYFYVEQKMHNVIAPRGGEAPAKAAGKAAPLKGAENKPREAEGADQLADQLTEPICEDLGKYVNSGKGFTHLCALYIHNGEKKKFLQLMNKFVKYSFGYEDLFILFYLMCRVNYRDGPILRKVLSALEMDYFKLDSHFSYPLSKALFAPHTNLHTAINHLPLIYKVKLVNMDRGSRVGGDFPHGETPMEGKNIRSDTTQHGDEELRGSFVEGHPQGKHPSVERVNDAEVQNVLENLQQVDMEQYEKEVSKDGVQFINLNVKRERRKIKLREGRHRGLKLKATLMTQIKDEVRKMVREGGEAVEAIEAIESVGMTGANGAIEAVGATGATGMTGLTAACFAPEERNAFQVKEVLTIFIHDKELARKNLYVQDLIEDVVKYLVAPGRTPLLCRNMLTLLAFMEAQSYYADKKLNRAVERALGGFIPSMNEWSEQGVYDFINGLARGEGIGRGVLHGGLIHGGAFHSDVIHGDLFHGDRFPNALAFLYDQQYTYNFALYEEDAPDRNKFHLATNKLLKNFLFLLSYMLRLPFLKFPIMKSYLNSFDFFLNIFIKNENVCTSLEIAEISFICESFVRRKIIDVSIAHKMLSLVRQAVGKCVKFHRAGEDDHPPLMGDADVWRVSTYPIYLNDILSILHFLHFFNLPTDQLHAQLIVICLGNFIHLNDTQKFILFNCVEALRRRTPNQIRAHVLNYFMYEQNLDAFLARNRGVHRESLGLLFVS
ncbi:hypothetical protein PVMG_02117 [Plasmodium vivax Mauritania I]|uniref:Uncharacterized protein n=2 Tax=Plasmodium vivax TaxID=5855 RepID=A0A0J9TAP1_PLAVI|nr:hypothetical protein PVBG_01165 [Plasmodium vivax Brazil I]KMZ92129.1 hypothetical protein PVMG_02117 [Plasmodium vivax Mauritania I]